jgi:hypothetical protein
VTRPIRPKDAEQVTHHALDQHNGECRCSSSSKGSDFGRYVRLLAVLLVPVAFGAGVVTGATLRPAPVVLTHNDPVAYTSSLPAWFCHYHER